MKPFCIEIPNFWAQADKFWGIWGIFLQTISTHFGTVISLSMLSIIQPLFLQNTKPLSRSQIFIWDWDLNLGRKELGIQPSCVRSPWSKGTQSNQSHHSPVVEKREQEEKTIKSHSKSKALLTFFCRLWTVLSPTSWITSSSKAELSQEGILFCTQFPSLGIFINKKVAFRKN